MIFSADMLITLLQALQLVALAPCLFVIAFLLLTVRKREALVPCLYFAALAAGFVLLLLPLWQNQATHVANNTWLRGSLIFAQSLLPALSFLLVIQFAQGRMPSLPYWGILALPLVGGSGVVYASLLAEELCFSGIGCVPTDAVGGIYNTFSNALLFLLLVVLFARARREGKAPLHERSRYWLIVSLICLNLLVTEVELLRVAGKMAVPDAEFTLTLLRMTFIYVVLTLLFRVFDRKAPLAEGETQEDTPLEEKDREWIAAFERLMQEEQAYREMECSRSSIAQALDVHENTVSRIINQHYGMRLNDVVNQYRVREAQRLLVANPDQAVTDIAFEVGFNSIPSFNRVFKESCGFSPREYRMMRLGRTKGG